MTALLDRRDAGDDLQDLSGDVPIDLDRPPTSAPEGEGEPELLSNVALALAVVSGALSSAAAAWMIGGIFRGNDARLVALLGVVLGAGLVYAGTRWRSPVLHYAVLPASLLAGAVLMGSASGSGTSSLPALVEDAVRSSQVLQPPIDAAPGWRLILVVLLALVSAASCALSLSMRRPRVAVALPVPLTIAAALVQPGSSAITTGAVSVGFVLMALSTSFVADGDDDTFDRAFELRRLGRSFLGGVVLVGLLIAASQLSFLFPEQDSSRIVPPRRPPQSPPQPDVPLYSIEGRIDGPLRVGVIDVYDVDEGAWMLPPIDSRRLDRLELPAALTDAPPALGEALRLTVRVEQAEGHLLPTPAGARRVLGEVAADYDPRTQSLALAGRPVFTGLRYEVLANPAPSGEQLSAVELEVPDALREFLAAPPVPPAVEQLLNEAPAGAYPRLQALRAALYDDFVAAGQGKPIDVGAERVVELLEGDTGSPYELTASEALLARWAGIPARMGFGYHKPGLDGEADVELRPADAATYLEVWFGEHGWIPIVGTPPRAQQSLTNNQRNNDPTIQSSPELGISVFLPVRNPDRLPIYAYARYYLARALAVGAVIGVALLLYPVVLKRVRRRRRAAWADARGAAGRVAVAYCDLRDQMVDLALPGRGATPLELVEVVADDEEHTELAWLVTRGLWGDLRDGLGEQDAASAEALAGSVRSRLTKAQPETARLLAVVSRASLKAPYSTEVPNVWWELRLRDRLPRPSLRPALTRLRRLRPSTVTPVVVLVAALLLGACSGSGSKAEPVVAFPTRLAPPERFAGLDVREEPKAAEAYAEGAADDEVIVSEGKVVSFTRNGLVQAALQVAQLKAGYVSTDGEVTDAIAESLGDVRKLKQQRERTLYSLVDGSQRVYLWFPTEKAMALLVVRTQIPAGAAEALARTLIDYGDGREIDEAPLAAALAALPAETAP